MAPGSWVRCWVSRLACSTEVMVLRWVKATLLGDPPLDEQLPLGEFEVTPGTVSSWRYWLPSSWWIYNLKNPLQKLSIYPQPAVNCAKMQMAENGLAWPFLHLLRLVLRPMVVLNRSILIVLLGQTPWSPRIGFDILCDVIVGTQYYP